MQNERLGVDRDDKPEQIQYMVIMPIIVAVLMAFSIVRFIGLVTSNQGLYVLGWTTLLTGMTRWHLGNVRGARKRLGQ